MSLNKKTFGIGALVLSLAVAAGLTLTAASGWTSEGGKAKASSASTTGSSCPMKTASADKAGCSASAMGACCAGAKAKTSSAGVTGGGCGMKGGAQASAEHPMQLPEGISMTSVPVEGGLDFLFTGKDLTAVQAMLTEHMKSCNDKDKAAKCGRTCSLSTTDKGLVLSVRGENPEQCCAGFMAQAGDEKGATMPSCPHLQGKADKNTPKKG